MDIARATAEYERWLGRLLTLSQADLALKHKHMRDDAFSFLRATFYRWVQLWDDHAGDLAKAPIVLAVGDLHVENFGTWRDREGRLIWGVNDVDEAARLPWTFDLARLATSARLAIAQSQLGLEPRDASAAILRGYRESCEAGGRAYVLAEHHHALRAMAAYRLHDPAEFWDKLTALPALKRAPPPTPRALLLRALPKDAAKPRYVHRVAGLGSLGRERYLALAQSAGAFVAREAKALAPSAVQWARGTKGTKPLGELLIKRAVRCADPFAYQKRGWILRRLAPDCSRIALAAIPRERQELTLLHAMGWETANLHLGSTTPRALLGELKHRGDAWLDRAAETMQKELIADWRKWREHH
jgi:hypothetical protein